MKAERLWLATHPQFSERWVQERIAADPSILGLGELDLKDKERIQPRAGRLDLLLQDPDTYRRYEVELQLGKTDETHIIRTIEYWDVERKRYPQYEHCAVIIAEDITSRFLNIISLFNGAIPLIAIKMSALAIGSSIALTFTTVLDEVQRGLEDEDEEIQQPADRAYWENRGSKDTVILADNVLNLVREFAPAIELKYNRHYIGFAQGGHPYNFAVLRARRAVLNVDLRLEQSEERDRRVEEAGMDLMDYDKRWGAYRIRLLKQDLSKHRELLIALLHEAYDERAD